MVLSPGKWWVRRATLWTTLAFVSGWWQHRWSGVQSRNSLRNAVGSVSVWVQYAYLRQDWHVRMFFSSGTAQTNGGGSFCIATYSFVSCQMLRLVTGSEYSIWHWYRTHTLVSCFAGHGIEDTGVDVEYKDWLDLGVGWSCAWGGKAVRHKHAQREDFLAADALFRTQTGLPPTKYLLNLRVMSWWL